MGAVTDILVVGGGAAGLLAARRAAECGASVTLLEKMPRLGMKILISGGGKCNLTHSGGMEDIRAQFPAHQARFLKPCFFRFSNTDFLNVLHARGMATYARPDGRVFPLEPVNAKDVVALLSRYVADAGVVVRPDAAVTGLLAEPDESADAPNRFAVQGVQVGTQTLYASRVIVCTGGASYPATGTTGDGWAWLQAVGHSIVPPRAALAPLYLADAQANWSGVALRDVRLRLRAGAGGKEISHWRGDLLFTHKGVSGPAALAVSRAAAAHMAQGASSLQAPFAEVDLLPDTPFEAMQSRLRVQLLGQSRCTVAQWTAPFIPSRLLVPLLQAADVPGETRGANLSAKALNRLASAVKGWTLGAVRAVPLERGEVTAGGVALDEVNPQTMQSRRVRGLYLCGEVLDLDGPIGGYNLQAAWSTGWAAGEAAAMSG